VQPAIVELQTSRPLAVQSLRRLTAREAVTRDASIPGQCVEEAVVGGLAVITIPLAEILRIGFGTKAVGWDNLV
jgi:hypothetical protein